MFYVVVCVSNQDHNQSTVPGYGQYNEAGGMAWLVERELLPMPTPDITLHYVRPDPERADVPKGSLQGLIKQCMEAKTWLDSQPTNAPKLALFLHTDSGKDFPHTWGCFGEGDVVREEKSNVAARVVGGEIARVFGREAALHNEYSRYYFWTLLDPHPSCLIEICSHETENDMGVLWANTALIAKAIMRGLQRLMPKDKDWEAVAAGYAAKLEAIRKAGGW